jgi:hypothetical protein
MKWNGEKGNSHLTGVKAMEKKELREPQPSPKGGTDTEVKDRGSPLEPLPPNLFSAPSASLRLRVMVFSI